MLPLHHEAKTKLLALSVRSSPQKSHPLESGPFSNTSGESRTPASGVEIRRASVTPHSQKSFIKKRKRQDSNLQRTKPQLFSKQSPHHSGHFQKQGRSTLSPPNNKLRRQESNLRRSKTYWLTASHNSPTVGPPEKHPAFDSYCRG